MGATSSPRRFQKETFAQFMTTELTNWNYEIHASAYGKSLNSGPRYVGRTWWAVVSGGGLGDKVAVMLVRWGEDRGWFTFDETDATEWIDIEVPASIVKKVQRMGLKAEDYLPAVSAAA